MTATRTTKQLTATELARNLSDVLNRVHYGGEQFLITRNGKPIATLTPPTRESLPTVGDLLETIRDLPRLGPSFGDDIEEVISNQSKSEPPVWES